MRWVEVDRRGSRHLGAAHSRAQARTGANANTLLTLSCFHRYPHAQEHILGAADLLGLPPPARTSVRDLHLNQSLRPHPATYARESILSVPLFAEYPTTRHAREGLLDVVA